MILIKVVTFFVVVVTDLDRAGGRSTPKSKMVNYFDNGDYYDVEMLYAVPL